MAATRRDWLVWAPTALAGVAFGCHALGCRARASNELLHVSFDATRELFEGVDRRAKELLPELAGVRVKQSHGGSAKQARSVIEGLDADLVSLALGYDLDALVDAGLVAAGWEKRLPFGASPFTSTIVLCVRPRNPKGISGFEDLVRPDVSVVTPNPKTSGAARMNHLAAWGHARRTRNTDAEAFSFMERLYANVPVMDSGARGALLTFVERKIGDVLLTWESDALLAASKGGVEVVYPARSVLAEPPVAVVDAVVEPRGTRHVATRYAELLFDDPIQKLVGEARFRPRSPTFAASFHELELFDVASLGGWASVHATHFAEDGLFDRLSERAAERRTP